MKKYKLLLSGIFLALTLALTSAHPGKVFADGNNPQETREKRASPQAPAPSPSSSIIDLIIRMIWML